MTYLSQLTVYRSASPPHLARGGVPGPFKGMQRERRGRRGQGGSANTLSASGRADSEEGQVRTNKRFWDQLIFSSSQDSGTYLFPQYNGN